MTAKTHSSLWDLCIATPPSRANTLLPTPDAALGHAGRKLKAADFSTLHIISHCPIIKNLFTETVKVL